MKQLFMAAVMVACYSFCQAQTKSIKDYFKDIPGQITTTDSAYKMVTGKNENPYDAYIKTVESELSALGKAAGDKSYFIAQAAGTYSDKIDYFKNEVKTKDKQLDSKLKEVNGNVHLALREWTRQCSTTVENNYNKEWLVIPIDVYDKNLAAEAKIYQELISKLKTELTSLEAYFVSKGFNKIIESKQSNNPYYYQSLEVRTYMVSKIKELVELAKGNAVAAAKYVKSCENIPGRCKVQPKY